jgi:hypothetical protein
MIRTYSSVVLLVLLFACIAHAQKSTTVNVYFHNEKLNPNQEDCTKVFPTPRIIPRTKAIARAALNELFKGTTEDEGKNEFVSVPAENTMDIVRGLNIRSGTAFLNFKKSVFEKLGNTTSSCGSGFYSSIEATLKQFPTVKRVVYAVEGNADDFYEWVQVGECPHGRLCEKRNFIQDQADVPEKVAFCDLIADPAKYDGRMVTTSATWRYGFEWDELYCRGCRDMGKTWRTVADPNAKTRALLRRLPKESGTVNAVFTGVFRASGGPFGDGSYRFRFEMSSMETPQLLSRASAVLEHLPARIQNEVCDRDEK